MVSIKKVVAMLLLGSAITLPAGAQVVREDGAKAITGVLYTTNGSAMAEWTFKSAGGEVMFASLDADIYRIQSAHEGEVTAAAEEPGGCSGEGGPGLFKLKVLDAADAELCSASRPRTASRLAARSTACVRIAGDEGSGHVPAACGARQSRRGRRNDAALLPVPAEREPAQDRAERRRHFQEAFARSSSGGF